MNFRNIQLDTLIRHWLGKISSTLFAILAFLYYVATSSPDAKVSKSIEEIATATGLSRRTVQPGLRELASLGAIQILSMAKERMLIQIPPAYWIPAAKAYDQTGSPTIPELISRVCSQQPSPKMLALLLEAAGDDELRLKHCLDEFARQRERWETINLLAVAVEHELTPRDYFDSYWDRRRA